MQKKQNALLNMVLSLALLAITGCQTSAFEESTVPSQPGNAELKDGHESIQAIYHAIQEGIGVSFFCDKHLFNSGNIEIVASRFLNGELRIEYRDPRSNTPDEIYVIELSSVSCVSGEVIQESSSSSVSTPFSYPEFD